MDLRNRRRRLSSALLIVFVAVASGCGGGGVQGALQAANEPGVLSEIRGVISGELTFATTCANFGYAQSFDDLARPQRGSSDGFILPIARNGATPHGYVFTLRAGDGATVVTKAADTCNGSDHDAVSSFFLEAHPAAGGGRSFAADERGTIYVRADGQPIATGMSGAEELK
jgi:hypothetical protein